MQGGVCDHSILLLAVNIPGGENWRLTTMLVQKMLYADICPRTLLYDINCRWWQFFIKWLGFHLGHLSKYCAAAALALFFPLPPFHAYMHSAACRQEQGLMNPTFPVFCQPCGEPPESYWSQMTNLARLRTATLEYATITTENMIAFINKRQRARLSTTVAKRVTTLLRRITSEEAELSEFMELLSLEQQVCCSS